jgi:hypothetical protein
MKYVTIILLLLFGALESDGQKYILLDKTMAQPAFYTNQLSVTEKFKGFLPVESKDIAKFIEALQEISQRLSSKKNTGNAKQYQIGCDKFKGTVIPLASEIRLDYLITSDCGGLKVSMHLCDANLNNDNNAYFINTWISYIKDNIGKKH